MKNAVVILVGGKGTRIQHILPNLPKPLAPICGRPFLGWIIDFLVKQGVDDIIFSAGYRSEQIKAFIGKINKKELRMCCVDEEAPLGTAGGVLNALDSSKAVFENVLILNGDSLTLTELDPLFKSFSDPSIGVSMVGVKVQDASRYGTLAIKEGNFLGGFEEKKPGRGLINA